MIDGKNTGLATPSQKSLKAGVHSITLQHHKYEDETIEVIIQEGQTKKISLEFKRLLSGVLELETEEGTEIYINNKKVGTTTLKKTLMPGNYFIELKKQGRFTEWFNQVIEKRKIYRIKKILKKKTGVFQIMTKPFGAKITINGKNIGNTTLVKRLPIGKYKLIIEKPGFENQKTTLTIAHQKTIEKTISLKKIPPLVTWDKTFGGSNYDRAYAIVQTKDGGYAIAGYTYSKGAGSADMWVVKVDAKGDLKK